VRLRLAAPALLFALLARGGVPASADGGDAPKPPPRLSVETLFGKGDAFTKPIPDLGDWRRGHDEWTTWRHEEGKPPVLVAVDAATGTKRDLFAFDLPASEKRGGPPARGIGRAAAPRLQWSADGEVAFVLDRGDVHRIDLASGLARRLTRNTSSISDVRPSPDGRKVAFARDYDAWVAMLDGDRVREVRLTTGGSEEKRNAGLDWVYPEELDAGTGLWWSPDSTRVAILSLDETRVPRHPIPREADGKPTIEWQRYPQPGAPNPVPSVGIASLDGRPIVRVEIRDADDVYVPWVAWMPDGKDVLVAVLRRSQRHLEVLVASAETGGAGRLLVEDDPAWVDAPPPPRFVDGGKALLWTSRRGGWWRHWRLSLGEREAPRSLTPDGEDAGPVLAVDDAAGVFAYEAASADGARRVVRRAPLDGKSAPVTIADGGWDHRASFSESSRWFVDHASKAGTPPRASLRRADGTEVRALGDATTPAWDAIAPPPPCFFDVEGEGGTPLHAMLWTPRDLDPAKRRPVIVETYGGPGGRMVRDAWGRPWEALLVQEGFLVFSLDGRGSAGRGKAFEAPIRGRLGEKELEDQLRGVAWLRAQPFVDPERIGIWGWSYGGTMTCLAMTRGKGAYRAGVAVAPVTDWTLYDSIYTERYMGLPTENAQGYAAASVLPFAKDLRGAFLLCHGLSDDNVHPENALRFVDALIEAHKPFDLMLYPGRGHGIEGPDARVDVHRRVLEHFRRHLLPASSPTVGK
jgi:dipeptidyl-peptidase-4